MTIAVYLRVSKEGGDSIANQRKLILDYIRRMPEWDGARIQEFCDDGYSGRNFERPAAARMLQLAKEGRIACIIVKDLSRFGRNYLEVGKYLFRVFPSLGVRLIAVNDHYDSGKPMESDSLDMMFRTLIHDMYSRDLSEKVKNALSVKAQCGAYLCALAPYGYQKDPEDKNRILPDPAAAPTVRRIFRLAADGWPTVRIARILNEEQVLTPMQYKRAGGCKRTSWNCVREANFWTPETILKILRDERYAGTAVYGRRKRKEPGKSRQEPVRKTDWITVQNAHPAVISQDEYRQAQQMLRTCKERGRTGKNKNPLRYKVRCGVCGHAMVRGGKKNPYYRCTVPFMTDRYACPIERIPAAELLEMIYAELGRQVAVCVDYNQIFMEKKRCLAADRAAAAKKLAKLQAACAGQEHHIQELYEKLVFGQVSRDEYVTAKACFLSRKREICEQIWQLQDEERKNGIQDNAGCGQTFEEEQEIRQAAKDMLAELLREVVIYPGCRVQIIWQVRDPFAAGGADLPQAGDACRQTKTACTSDTDGSGF